MRLTVWTRIFLLAWIMLCLPAAEAQFYQKNGQNCIKSVMGGADMCTPMTRIPEPEPEPIFIPVTESAYQIGMREFDQGNWQAALNAFAQADAEKPGDPYIQERMRLVKNRLMAQSYAARADAETACNVAIFYQKEANKLWPENDHGRMQRFEKDCAAQYANRGRAAEASGNLEEAYRLYAGAASLQAQDSSLETILQDLTVKLHTRARQASQRSDYAAALSDLEFLCNGYGTRKDAMACHDSKEISRKKEAADLALDPNQLPVINPAVLKNWNPPDSRYGKPRPLLGPSSLPYGSSQMKRIKALAPMDPQAPATRKYNAGFEALKANSPKVAITRFQEALRLNPQDVRIANALSLAQAIDAGQEQNRRNALTLIAQSNAVMKTTGDFAKGYQMVNNALYMQPDNPYLQDAKDLIGKLYKAEFESPLKRSKLPAGRMERIQVYASEAAVLTAGGDYRSAYNCMLQAYSLAPQSALTKAGLKQTWEVYQEKQAAADQLPEIYLPASLVAPRAAE